MNGRDVDFSALAEELRDKILTAKSHHSENVSKLIRLHGDPGAGETEFRYLREAHARSQARMEAYQDVWEMLTGVKWR